MTAHPPKRFDEMSAWRALSPSAQEELGRAAIALAVATYGAEIAENETQECAFLAAIECARADIETLTEDVFSRDEVPGIPASLGPVCVECGISEYDEDGPAFAWAKDGRCSNCAAEDPATAPDGWITCGGCGFVHWRADPCPRDGARSA